MKPDGMKALGSGIDVAIDHIGSKDMAGIGVGVGAGVGACLGVGTGVGASVG